MGSGKTFFMVGRVLDVIIRDGRPVYTNLPLKWRVIRKYLRDRGGEQYANLIVELSEEHWKTFLERQHLKSKFRATTQMRYRLANKPLSTRFLQLLWEMQYGPDVVRPGGRREANWIEPAASIWIDESHHWHSVEDNMARKESPALKAYLTMLRHHLHDLHFATQSEGNLPTTIKRLCEDWWTVRNLSHRRLAWGIRPSMFGLRYMGYQNHRGVWKDQSKSNNADADESDVENFTIWPTMPNRRWKFRLYKSFTHVESPRAMMESLRRSRIECGLDPDGSLIGLTMDESSEKGSMKNVITSAIVASIFGSFAAAGVSLATSPDRPSRPPEPSSAVLQPDSTQPDFTIRGLQPGAVNLATGRSLPVGATVDGFTLASVDPRSGRIVWVRGDDRWMQSIRHQQTTRLPDIPRSRGDSASPRHGPDLDPGSTIEDTRTD